MKVWHLLNDGNANGPQVMSISRAQNGTDAVDVDITTAAPGTNIYFWLHITATAGATPGIITQIIGYNRQYSHTLSQLPDPEIIDFDRTVTGWYLIGTIPSEKYQTVLAIWTLDGGTTSITGDIFATW